MPDPLDHLAAAFNQADDERAADINRVAELDGDLFTYLERVGELEDPVTDGIEGGCI